MNLSHYISHIAAQITAFYQARRHVFKSGPAVFRASAEGTSGVVEHERDVAPLVRGVRAISPEKSFDMWLALFAF